MKSSLTRRGVLRARAGATLPEYGLMIALIAVVVGVAVGAVGQQLKTSCASATAAVMAALAADEAAATPP